MKVAELRAQDIQQDILIRLRADRNRDQACIARGSPGRANGDRRETVVQGLDLHTRVGAAS